MSYALNLNRPLQSIFWPKKDRLIKRIALILAGVCVLALASQLSIPLQPVPLTFQSATVVLIGMAYGSRYGVGVIATYLIAGACGLPLFANFSGGIHEFFAPTAGYLIGFLPAAFLSGYLAEHGWARSISSSLIAACLGVGIIFLCGISVLSLFVDWHQALVLGVAPFIFSELIKLIALSLIMPRLWKKQS